MSRVIEPLNVDVTGMSMNLPEITVSGGVQPVRFILDQDRKHGVPMHLAAFFSKSVLSDAVFSYPRRMRVAVLMESPIDQCYSRVDEVVRRFPLVFTHQRELIAQGPPFVPLLFGTNWLGIQDAESTSSILESHPVKSQLVSFIGSLQHPDTGAYRFRRQVAELAIRRDDVECFGKGIRSVASKQEAIAPFRFSIAMENAAADHYFSEKLIDCLLLETVPIYFGCAGIGELLDRRGMLCFSSLEELISIIDKLTPSLYEEMRPYLLANKERVVAQRWHNHPGLLQRLSEQIPVALMGARPRECRVPTRAERWVARMLRKADLLA